MKKIDLKKELKHLYVPSAKQVEVVDVPEFQFAMLDGVIRAGEAVAESQSFQDGMTALYGISYGLKFASKLREKDPIDYTVMAVEGLWWAEGEEFTVGRKQALNFTLMMLQPDHITQEMYQDALQELKEKKPNPSLEEMRFERFHEGLSMQIMHVGPYSEEPRTVEKMEAFARENGYVLRGRHHEIYIGDPRRAKPERLRTVLRHPIEKGE